jgi:hypothetical protein
MLLRFHQQERHQIPKEIITIFITWEPHTSLGISFRLSHSSQINKRIASFEAVAGIVKVVYFMLLLSDPPIFRTALKIFHQNKTKLS